MLSVIRNDGKVTKPVVYITPTGLISCTIVSYKVRQIIQELQKLYRSIDGMTKASYTEGVIHVTIDRTIFKLHQYSDQPHFP